MSFQLFQRSLQDRSDWRGGPAKRGVAASKYIVRSALQAQRHAAWLRFLYETPRMTAIVEGDPRLHERPQHNYINRSLRQARCYAIIESHYRYVLAHWPSTLVDRIYTGSGASLGRLTLKDGSEAELQLRVPLGRSREGELALYLLDAAGRALSSIICTLADEGRSLLIGCLQGAAPGLGRDEVREFTKQAHGLRPKNLLLSMVYALAATVGVTDIRGVSNDAHPFSGEDDKIKADYDSFWVECQGERLPDGFYALPLHEPVRDEAQVESKHRSAFRKREALRHTACALMANALRDTSAPAA